YPDEIEIAVIGPVTNLALAMMKDPETMKHLKCIWTMGTTGFGKGNTTPVSEFNVYADPEAYKVMMDFGVHVYVGGYDLCTSEAAWFDEDTERLLKSGTKAAEYAVLCNEKLAQFCYAIGRQRRIDLPDAVSLSPMLWSDVIVSSSECVSHVCTEHNETYGQVIFYDGRMLAGMGPGFENGYYGKTEPNCTVIYEVDNELYKKRLEELLTRE
ncbi:MAG: nucleoside hydrolase, partial [Erysipelotrichaceae bacterium]|nr:nucleoside hydrolase [Erysipelotrichaceae bacterium]